MNMTLAINQFVGYSYYNKTYVNESINEFDFTTESLDPKLYDILEKTYYNQTLNHE